MERDPRKGDQNSEFVKRNDNRGNRPGHPICGYCSQEHHISTCQRFKEKPVEERSKLAMEANLCFVCLKGGHRGYRCQSGQRCETCQGRHNTLLHRSGMEIPQTETPVESNETTKPLNPEATGFIPIHAMRSVARAMKPEKNFPACGSTG